MKIRESVFKSYSERMLYKALNSRWGKRLNLFASLSFTNIIDIEDASLTERQKQFLFATSVDFTLCEKETDKPLLSIEFDGLGHGFSRDGEYIEILPSKDPYRKLKFDLKLRLAREVYYPFFVVSYEEGFPFSAELNLSIVDGIIGKVLKGIYLPKALQERIHELEEEPCENYERMKEIHEAFSGREYSYFDYVDDWAVGVEVETEIEWNPVAGKAGELLEELGRGEVIKGMSEQWLREPVALGKITRVGCQYTVDSHFGRVDKTVWVRNISHPSMIRSSGFDIFPTLIARDIAELLALQEVHKRFLKPT